jgi:protein-S-isoprenylcysteine O-methyltransferase Ste14
MYLSILLLLIAFTALTVSFLSFIVWLIAFILFNRMVIFEESELIKILGKEYEEYMKQVPRWIPRPTALWNQ